MTGDCYIVAAHLVVEDFTGELVLVHGWPTLQCPPFERYGHAWVETPDGLVIDRSNGRVVTMPAAVYYALGCIEQEECARYTREETLARLLEHEHYGPWEEPASS